MPPLSDDDKSSLEKVREQLYAPHTPAVERPLPIADDESQTPHEWETPPLEVGAHPGQRHVRLATLFFGVAVGFFCIALAAAGYFFYLGGNSVSVDKIDLEIQGPTTIAGGDTVPLSLTIRNRNPVAVQNATIEIDFPSSTLQADGSLHAYPRYIEHIDTLESGATLTRSIKSIIFGGAGETLSLPVSFAYGTGGSTTVFVKKSTYTLAVSSTPLSVSVDAQSEAVAGKPITLTLAVRSNATIPLTNVALVASLPFGFTVTNSSIPFLGSTFALGTLQPGASKTVTLTGTLDGQEGEQRVFHFAVGTTKSTADQTLAVSYMTQDASVVVAAPFIATTLSLNGDQGTVSTLAPGAIQNVTVAYINKLLTSVTNATVEITLSGTAVDYTSIQTTSGFYRSADHTIVFSRDSDSALAQLAPGASGVGAFSFSTLPTGALTTVPSVTFTISVSGTRVGQTNVPETVSATSVKTVKLATVVAVSAATLHTSGPISNTGPIPPMVDVATTYTVVWAASTKGSAVADGLVTATIPVYVAYTGKTSGTGVFTYDNKSRTLTWKPGDLPQGGSSQGYFQVSLTPSLSQRGSAPTLMGPLTFGGYDRFAGVPVSASAGAPTTETRGDPGYSPKNASVQ